MNFRVSEIFEGPIARRAPGRKPAHEMFSKIFFEFAGTVAPVTVFSILGTLATVLGNGATIAVGGAFILNVRDKRFGNAAVDFLSLGIGGAASYASKALPAGVRLAQNTALEVMGRAASSVCTGK